VARPDEADRLADAAANEYRRGGHATAATAAGAHLLDLVELIDRDIEQEAVTPARSARAA
jgi:hypothetical protein